MQITTKDGATFTGDILVGADGVHSQTRAEMWRIADAEDPNYGTKRLAKCMLLSHSISILHVSLLFSNHLYVQMYVRYC